MYIKINGKDTTIESSLTIEDFIKLKELDPHSLVVEYNYEIVKKAEWSNITLRENDNLEILRFVGGG